MNNDKRISVVLSEDQLRVLYNLQDEMDIDLSKLIRWCIDSCIDLGNSQEQMYDLLGTDITNSLRGLHKSKTNYLLDSISRSQ